MECTYAELRREPNVLEAIENGLFGEQGSICAYTGHRIELTPADSAGDSHRAVDFHIEHLTPQAHCRYGKDTDYANLVACWPRPNCGFEPAYGARKKGSWPSSSEQAYFVSPLLPDCSARFAFNWRGEIRSAREDDAAACETIKRLGLDHPTLTDLRKAAIRGALYPASQRIRLTDAHKLLKRMQQASEDVNRGISTQLLPFCFAVQPALEREIRKLEAIRKQA
jgi:uncharacterized protein (TIGR02646 family)